MYLVSTFNILRQISIIDEGYIWEKNNTNKDN